MEVTRHNGLKKAESSIEKRCPRVTYLFGASSSEKRNFMAPYALQWKAIEIAKSRVCIEYDLFGVSPRPEPIHPMYGLYQFNQVLAVTFFTAWAAGITRLIMKNTSCLKLRKCIVRDIMLIGENSVKCFA